MQNIGNYGVNDREAFFFLSELTSSTKNFQLQCTQVMANKTVGLFISRNLRNAYVASVLNGMQNLINLMTIRATMYNATLFYSENKFHSRGRNQLVTMDQALLITGF
ncbi:hypothetical protein CAPTEDRAFT_203575 [Capitella teleta]|uniref:Uncharacterized protein n=1 Tax=Capitella teleta TaxID=283909 RepID=R7T5A0_CAPTE|nr:hypothetical protein CAPTEDRAFT_203575 [Capitella teleta]|eukprot:ELT88141.1 hypothetical protein CAPTEDRAFT_203575 [Capitella teleta]